jgi:hypothetical protein
MNVARLLVLGCCVLVLSVLAGCGPTTYTVPENADRIEIYSIDGNDYDDPEQRPKTEEKFYDYPVLGKVELTDPEARKELLALLRDTPPKFEPTSCYWPRHGVRVIDRGVTMDYEICFQCSRIHWHRGSYSAGRNVGENGESMRAMLNKHLEAAGVPLAHGARKEEEWKKK